MCGPTGVPAEAGLRRSPDQCPSAAPAVPLAFGPRASSELPWATYPPKVSLRTYYVYHSHTERPLLSDGKRSSYAGPPREGREGTSYRLPGHGARGVTVSGHACPGISTSCDGREDKASAQAADSAEPGSAPPNLSGLRGRPDPKDKAEETQRRSWTRGPGRLAVCTLGLPRPPLGAQTPGRDATCPEFQE